MTTVWVTFQQEGFHQYPDAPDEVAYLRDRHRHIFHFRVEMAVFHDNREIEFHMLRKRCLELYANKNLEADDKSCEMLAKDLLSRVHAEYGLVEAHEHNGIHLPRRRRNISITVSEDGECGSTVTNEA